MQELPAINRDWTLFLDRDGVINYEKVDDYIHHWDEFQFYPGAAEAVALMSRYFGRTIVVTNQKGIGKGVTQEADVLEIHRNMENTIVGFGGKIDAIYYCTATDANAPCRKPNAGMAFQAKKDFPSIDFKRSIMVGNNPSDMQFGRNAEMITVLVTTTRDAATVAPGLVDLIFNDLQGFAATLDLR